MVEWNESQWSRSRFWNLPQYRSYKLDLLGAGYVISYLSQTLLTRTAQVMKKSFSKVLQRRITDRTALMSNRLVIFTKRVSNRLLTRKLLSKTLVLYDINSPPCCLQDGKLSLLSQLPENPQSTVFSTSLPMPASLPFITGLATYCKAVTVAL